MSYHYVDYDVMNVENVRNANNVIIINRHKSKRLTKTRMLHI